MVERYIALDVDDPRTSSIADVISNKTCKRILSLLAEKEMSESDIALKLGMPLNTVGYNVKKLVDAGLIEKVNKFFWSSKGKRINTYKISNKKIVISPKSIVKGVVPTILISILAALLIKVFIPGNYVSEISKQSTSGGSGGASLAAPAASNLGNTTSTLLASQNIWLWFLLGAFCALFVYLVYNWVRRK